METKHNISHLIKLSFKTTCLLILGIVVLISCTNNDDPNPIIGKWSDNIVLSQKSATLNSNTNSITITTKYSGWWIAGISLDNKYIDLKGINILSENLKIINADFQLERNNGNTIIITMNQNTTNSERILYINLQGGDYFDGIKIIQSK